MSGQNSVDKILDTIAVVLIKCFIIGILLLTIWLVLVMGLPDWIWQKHGQLFDLSGEQVVLVQYTGLLITKIGIFVLFLIPYAGIKLARRCKSGKYPRIAVDRNADLTHRAQET